MAANAGRILLMSKGDYNPSTEYKMLDIVRDGGKTWVCKQTCTGQTPSENTYWFLLCQDGASWASIADKPFNTIGSNGLIINTDVLDVDLLKIERKASTLTSKATVVLADEMVIVDSADSSITKRSPLSALKTKLDTLYNNYSLPTASTTTLGGVKVGTGLEMDGETLNTTGSGGGTVINDPTTTPATPLETTNVLDDITSIMNNSTANQVAGALALKEVNSNLDTVSDALDTSIANGLKLNLTNVTTNPTILSLIATSPNNYCKKFGYLATQPSDYPPALSGYTFFSCITITQCDSVILIEMSAIKGNDGTIKSVRGYKGTTTSIIWGSAY